MNATQAIRKFEVFLNRRDIPLPEEIEAEKQNVIVAITDEIRTTPEPRTGAIYERLITIYSAINYPPFYRLKTNFSNFIEAYFSNLFGEDWNEETKTAITRLFENSAYTPPAKRKTWQCKAVEEAEKRIHRICRELGITRDFGKPSEAAQEGFTDESGDIYNVVPNLPDSVLEMMYEEIPATDGATQEPADDETTADTLPPLPACLSLTQEDKAHTRATFENAVQAGYMERTPDGYKWTHDKGTELAFICGLLVSEDQNHQPDTLEPLRHNKKKWMYGIFPRKELKSYFGLDMGAIRDRRQQAAQERKNDRGIISPPTNYKELLQLFPDDPTEK